MNEQKVVEILGGQAGAPGRYLSHVYNAETGQYFAPLLADSDWNQQIEAMHSQQYTGKNVTSAIIDTGVLSSHPWIKSRLVESVDFTGTGVEDRNGHGTLVALLMLATAPGTAFYSIKALDDRGQGTQEALIAGIRWAAEKKVRVLNISAGIHNRRWGLGECQGDCEICREAERAAQSGVFICAAAGNEPGVTYCPATLAVKKDIGMAVEALDIDTHTRWPKSGAGTIGAPAGGYYLVKVG